jgi:hypothetical protein
MQAQISQDELEEIIQREIDKEYINNNCISELNTRMRVGETKRLWAYWTGILLIALGVLLVGMGFVATK